MSTIETAKVAMVPATDFQDFDSIYVVTLRRSHGKLVASFTLDHEGLDGRSTRAPADGAVMQLTVELT